MGAFTTGRRDLKSPPASSARRTATVNLPSSLITRPQPHPGQPINRPAGSTSAVPYSVTRNLTAAARAIDLNDANQAQALARRRASATDAWQSEAWEYFDLIGEIKFAFSLVANVLSRVRLYAAEVSDPSSPPSPADPNSPGGGAARAALSRLDSAYGGQAGLLRDAALNLCVTGECYLVQIPAVRNPLSTALSAPESWDIRSTDELEVDKNGKATLLTRRDAGNDAAFKKELPKTAFTARIWRPHPRFSDEADSSMRGLLDACAELLLLNKTFRSTARSRLNSGMLLLPDSLGVSAIPDPEMADPSSEDPAEEETDDFEESLIESMTTPIADEESAAAVVPLLVRGPAEALKEIRLVQFERTFDPALASRADKVLDRILAGIDVPKDVVAGMANVKYANAAVIDESLYKAHIEPLALLLCDALTVVYLRPALKAAGVDQSELEKYVIWYDPSEVTTRPNKADDADNLYAKQLISGAANRRAHGFSEDDKPDSTELALRMLIEKGASTPELTEALLQVFAPEVMAKVREASQSSNPAPLPDEVAQALGGGSTEPSAPVTDSAADTAPPAAAPAPAVSEAPNPNQQPTPINAEDLA